MATFPASRSLARFLFPIACTIILFLGHPLNQICTVHSFSIPENWFHNSLTWNFASRMQKSFKNQICVQSKCESTILTTHTIIVVVTVTLLIHIPLSVLFLETDQCAAASKDAPHSLINNQEQLCSHRQGWANLDCWMELPHTSSLILGIPVSRRYYDDDDYHYYVYPAYSHHDKIPPWWGNVSNLVI